MIRRVQLSPDETLKEAFVPKPYGYTGSTFATPISNIRITGDATFVETVAGLFKSLQDLEGVNTRLEINLKQIEDQQTEALTDNFALYLSIAERG